MCKRGVEEKELRLLLFRFLESRKLIGTILTGYGGLFAESPDLYILIENFLTGSNEAKIPQKTQTVRSGWLLDHSL